MSLQLRSGQWKPETWCAMRVAAGAGLAQESYKLSELLSQFQFGAPSQYSPAVAGPLRTGASRAA